MWIFLTFRIDVKLTQMMFSNLFQVILLKECCLSWFGNEKCVMGVPVM